MANGFIFYTFSILLLFASLLMILLVLIQRGRGGGLAGAFGGMGGQSAFGTRAGDVFTKITVGVAVVWVLTAGVLGISMRARAAKIASGEDSIVMQNMESDSSDSADDAAPTLDATDSDGDADADSSSSESTDSAEETANKW